MIGPPNKPWPIRQKTSISKLVDKPQNTENMVKPIRLKVKTLTPPKRPASQPVKGTQIASATA